MNPIRQALRGKGIAATASRARALIVRYGLTYTRISHSVERMTRLVSDLGGGATLFIAACLLDRYHLPLDRWRVPGIELAVHGYFHHDYLSIPGDQQAAHLIRARRAFARGGLHPSGFRAPYLRANDGTLEALAEQGFLYDASPSLYWDVLPDNAAYQSVLRFYGAADIRSRPSLPVLVNGLIRIPYSLPDDEALIERFGKQVNGNPWLDILTETHRCGELFVLGLHPERIDRCEAWLVETIRCARALTPTVWLAPLSEIAEWWRARAAAEVHNSREGEAYALRVAGPPGTAILTRGVSLRTPAEPGYGGWDRCQALEIRWQGAAHPFIGVLPGSDSALSDFLRQQGYLVETGAAAAGCTHTVHRTHFSEADARPLLDEIERGSFPLIRLARWKDAAASALCITGDVDAMTLWDYPLRWIER